METPGDPIPFVLFDLPSFDVILDETLDRLWGKKIRHTLERLDKLEDTLDCLEEDLEEMIRTFCKHRIV
jgi:hypothetical protein